ncbi:MAG: exodeoxyribonuclease VII small subunit [candidate division Zixibacteria bacterium]|nr:exodeoxyribonuclease VII small subunit [candidate division Zixibacteria bacterium]
MNTKAKKEYKDFESAIARLEEITSELESEDLSLEDSIAHYTEGVEIAAICNKKLVEAEGQIAKLSKLTDKFTLEALEDGNDN